MIEHHIARIGIPPLFLIYIGLTRYDGGVQANIGIYIYKLGFHMGLSSID